MMDADRGELIKQLQQLRRGHGLLAVDVVARVGQELAAACGLDPDQRPGARRQLLAERIATEVAALPADLRLALRAAFALPGADQSRFLRERMQWLGRELGRDPRTALRRVESGLALLAERLATTPVDVPAGENAPAACCPVCLRAGALSARSG
jgi:hypothetical protein